MDLRSTRWGTGPSGQVGVDCLQTQRGAAEHGAAGTQGDLEMLDLEWYEAVELLHEHIFQISTPSGSGTGFLLWVGEASGLCGIATAAHVIGHADRRQEPIRLQHYASGQSILLHEGDRATFH